MDDEKGQIAWIWFGLLLTGAMGACFLLALFVISGGAASVASGRSVPENMSHSSSMSQIQILDRTFDSSQLARGREIYLQNCAACHGAEGRGQFPEAPFQPDRTGRIGAPPHNDTGHSWHHSDVLLVRYVTEGGFSDLTRFYLMPPFGDVLTDEQIMLVIAHIKTLWTDEQRARQRQLTIEEATAFP